MKDDRKIFNWFADLGEKIEEFSNRPLPYWLALLIIVAFVIFVVFSLVSDSLIMLFVWLALLVAALILTIPWSRLSGRK